jgi:hypothetical protein
MPSSRPETVFDHIQICERDTPRGGQRLFPELKASVSRRKNDDAPIVAQRAPGVLG